MIGRIGHDSFGEPCRANLAANGIRTEYVAMSDVPTGCAFITVDEAGGQQVISVRGLAGG